MIQILAGAMMVAARVKEPDPDFTEVGMPGPTRSDLSNKRPRKRKLWRFGRQDNDV